MRLTKQQFLDRFTPAEMQAVLGAARVSVAVEAWLFRFNSVTPDADGSSIDTEDRRTIAGLQSLEAASLLGPGRAAEILGDGALTSAAGFELGQVVRTKPPFEEIGEQTITRIELQADGQVAITLGAAGAFASVYLEPLE